MDDPARNLSPEMRARDLRHARAIHRAKLTGKTISYIDDDGCEVTVTSSGHSTIALWSNRAGYAISIVRIIKNS